MALRGGFPREVMTRWNHMHYRVFLDREASRYVGIGPFEERDARYEYIRVNPDTFTREGMISDILKTKEGKENSNVLPMVSYWGIVDIWLDIFGMSFS